MSNKRKRQRREFEQFAERKIPKFFTNSVEIQVLTGAELLEWGFKLDPNDETKKIDPKKKYVYRQPVISEVNHGRRIHDCFEQRGPDGVNEYLLLLAKKLNKTAQISEVKDVTIKEDYTEQRLDGPRVEQEPPTQQKSFMQRLSNFLHGE